jgi:glycosyltransferase involved in cell wall biosynthesis
MRILGLTNLYPSPWFPLRGVFNRQIFRALSKQDDVRLIVPISWTDELKVPQSSRRNSQLCRNTTLDGIPVEHPRYLFPPKILRGFYGHCFLNSVKGAFRRAVEAFRPDVVLAAWAYPDGWAAVELAHRFGLPAVVKLHGSDVLVQSKIPACRSRLASCLRNADGVIAVSRDLESKAIALGADPSRVRTVYDGVDPAIFRPGDRGEARSCLGLPADQRIVLFIGNLVAVKGVDLLLEACKRLVDRGEPFHCYLVGQGVLRAELEHRAAELGLGSRVTFIGPVQHAELANWYRASNVFVLPSRSEGVPCVLLEAAACQTPFVASRVGGIPEVAQWGAARLTPPEDPAALAEAIAVTLGQTEASAGFPAYSRTFDDAAAEVRSVLRAAIRSQDKTNCGSQRAACASAM